MLDLLASWNGGQPVRELQGFEPDLAVARGAAIYGRHRATGKGIRIKAGTARSYYIGLETSMPAIPGYKPPMKALCVVPHRQALMRAAARTILAAGGDALSLVEEYTALLRVPQVHAAVRNPVRYCFKLVFPDGKCHQRNVLLEALRAQFLRPRKLLPAGHGKQHGQPGGGQQARQGRAPLILATSRSSKLKFTSER